MALVAPRRGAPEPAVGLARYPPQEARWLVEHEVPGLRRRRLVERRLAGPGPKARADSSLASVAGMAHERGAQAA